MYNALEKFCSPNCEFQTHTISGFVGMITTQRPEGLSLRDQSMIGSRFFRHHWEDRPQKRKQVDKPMTKDGLVKFLE